MQQNFTGGTPPRSPYIQTSRVDTEAGQGDAALLGGFSLGELIRAEHGKAGVASFVAAINPMVPYAFLEKLCQRLDTQTPPRPVPSEAGAPQPSKKKSKPAIKPEQLLSLMQMKDNKGSSGLDPAMLIKLFNQK